MNDDQQKSVLKNRSKGDSEPLVTVLMSTYNRADFLPVAIRSILQQTYRRFELIIVRDGGQPIEHIVRSFNDDRIRFIDRSENRGKAASLNEALSIAQGSYVSYLDDDDLWYPNHLQVLIDALRRHPEYGLAYTDLYKSHYRLLPGPRRQILSKNLEISRDFDRLLMLQFNHVLHVSLMHRRDLLDTAGDYNEGLNVLIDWDLTRRLCFYTDFLHVPIVTGEYFSAIENSDRISIQRRKNVSDYLRNLLTIRTTRPPKPWVLPDLSVVVLHDKADDALMQTLRTLWSHSFYPKQIYLPLAAEEFEKVRSSFPNVCHINVSASCDVFGKLDHALKICEGDFTAVVQTGLTVNSDEACFLERSLNPLLTSSQSRIAFEIVEAGADHWGAVFRKTELQELRQQYPQMTIRQAAQAAGIEIRKPSEAEYPFQFDNLLTAVTDLQLDGQWLRAARVVEYMAQHFGNTHWMQTLRANALYWAGQVEESAEIAHALNQHFPTVSRLLIEGRCHKKKGQFHEAIGLYQRAEAILENGFAGDMNDIHENTYQTEFSDKGCV